MDPFKNTTDYSIPIYFKDQTNDLKNIEAEAKRALQNINSLYKEIMHTDSYSQSNFELDNTVVSSDSPSTSTSSIDKQQCSANVNRFCRTSKKFYFHPQLPLAHCVDCHDQYCKNKKTSRSESVEEKPSHNQFCKNNKTSRSTSVEEKHNHNQYCINNKTRSVSVEEKLSYESEIHFSKDSYAQCSNSTKSTFKITKPKPFKLSGFDEQRVEAKQRKLAKLMEEREKKIEKELNVKIVSKPVPKHTHLHLYNEMVEKNEKRKNERKEESLKIVGKTSGSLPLDENFQTNSKSEIVSSETKSCFKAKPVPKNILSNKVNEKIKSKEEIRKMLCAHRAEEMLKQSSSPLSMKTISRSYSMLDLSDYKNERNKLQKPNITEITNRLYTKKCKETLNNWNDEVRRHSYIENKSKSNLTISNKLKKQPEQILPFLYYPVRMSNAASLRSKQIRSEILAREKREEGQNNEIGDTLQEMREEISNKLQKIIPNIDPDKEIEEKVKNFRESQINRKEEYEHELEEIIKRVSKKCLLIERQSKKGNKKEDSFKDVTYEKEDFSQLNSDTDSKSDHLEEKESGSEKETSSEIENSNSFSE